MIKTFLISLKLKNAYKVNSIIYSLKSIPLIKKLLPASLYASRGLKKFANVISLIIEFCSIFAGKAIYLAIIWSQTQSMKAAPASSFAHMLIFLSLIGGFMNTQIFNPTKDKFYAMFIMRLDAKEYTLTNYFFFLLKMLVGITAFSLVFGRMCGASFITCFAAPVYVICIKLCFTALSLDDCENQSKTLNENKLSPLIWVGAAALLAAAALPYLGVALSERVLQIIAAVLITPAVFAGVRIARFNAYRPIYKELLRPESIAPMADKSAAGAAQQLAMQKKISADISQTSNKSGYKYFNELFMKRHSKLLTKSAKRITAAAAVILAAAVIAVFLFPNSRPDINELLMTYLPYFLFVMYMINRGKVITQAMFLNCDHSMLAYRFYRTPSAILSLFVARLKYIILINLMPACVIALGLPLLLYLTGGTDEPLNYLVLFVSIIAMSIFFSVHNIVLYYLLQPYNVNLESKNAAYGIVNWVTYMICYAGIQVKLPTPVFGSVISVFCIVYAVAAFIIAYKLAPKTFKLRS